ncbi:unnamed protein product [Rangifer tarandus platyrhynchus]|uniref:Uncharacterized protein n=1 Tax=Rangifer tarandus platyrhynchus TaxID=3082113 RepID=A0ABN8XI62_RANTA|nr:unnamed protein product [Rangifer tarandus platyrhynchus]
MPLSLRKEGERRLRGRVLVENTPRPPSPECRGLLRKFCSSSRPGLAHFLSLINRFLSIQGRGAAARARASVALLFATVLVVLSQTAFVYGAGGPPPSGGELPPRRENQSGTPVNVAQHHRTLGLRTRSRQYFVDAPDGGPDAHPPSGDNHEAPARPLSLPGRVLRSGNAQSSEPNGQGLNRWGPGMGKPASMVPPGVVHPPGRRRRWAHGSSHEGERARGKQKGKGSQTHAEATAGPRQQHLEGPPEEESKGGPSHSEEEDGRPGPAAVEKRGEFSLDAAAEKSSGSSAHTTVHGSDEDMCTTVGNSPSGRAHELPAQVRQQGEDVSSGSKTAESTICAAVELSAGREKDTEGGEASSPSFHTSVGEASVLASSHTSVSGGAGSPPRPGVPAGAFLGAGDRREDRLRPPAPSKPPAAIRSLLPVYYDEATGLSWGVPRTSCEGARTSDSRASVWMPPHHAGAAQHVASAPFSRKEDAELAFFSSTEGDERPRNATAHTGARGEAQLVFSSTGGYDTPPDATAHTGATGEAAELAISSTGMDERPPRDVTDTGATGEAGQLSFSSTGGDERPREVTAPRPREVLAHTGATTGGAPAAETEKHSHNLPGFGLCGDGDEGPRETTTTETPMSSEDLSYDANNEELRTVNLDVLAWNFLAPPRRPAAITRTSGGTSVSPNSSQDPNCQAATHAEFVGGENANSAVSFPSCQADASQTAVAEQRGRGGVSTSACLQGPPQGSSSGVVYQYLPGEGGRHACSPGGHDSTPVIAAVQNVLGDSSEDDRSPMDHLDFYAKHITCPPDSTAQEPNSRTPASLPHSFAHSSGGGRHHKDSHACGPGIHAYDPASTSYCGRTAFPASAEVGTLQNADGIAHAATGDNAGAVEQQQESGAYASGYYDDPLEGPSSRFPSGHSSTGESPAFSTHRCADGPPGMLPWSLEEVDSFLANEGERGGGQNASRALEYFARGDDSSEGQRSRPAAAATAAWQSLQPFGAQRTDPLVLPFTGGAQQRGPWVSPYTGGTQQTERTDGFSYTGAQQTERTGDPLYTGGAQPPAAWGSQTEAEDPLGGCGGAGSGDSGGGGSCGGRFAGSSAAAAWEAADTAARPYTDAAPCLTDSCDACTVIRGAAVSVCQAAAALRRATNALVVSAARHQHGRPATVGPARREGAYSLAGHPRYRDMPTIFRGSRQSYVHPVPGSSRRAKLASYTPTGEFAVSAGRARKWEDAEVPADLAARSGGSDVWRDTGRPPAAGGSARTAAATTTATSAGSSSATVTATAGSSSTATGGSTGATPTLTGTTARPGDGATGSSCTPGVAATQHFRPVIASGTATGGAKGTAPASVSSFGAATTSRGGSKTAAAPRVGSTAGEGKMAKKKKLNKGEAGKSRGDGERGFGLPPRGALCAQGEEGAPPFSLLFDAIAEAAVEIAHENMQLENSIMEAFLELVGALGTLSPASVEAARKSMKRFACWRMYCVTLVRALSLAPVSPLLPSQVTALVETASSSDVPLPLRCRAALRLTFTCLIAATYASGMGPLVDTGLAGLRGFEASIVAKKEDDDKLVKATLPQCRRSFDAMFLVLECSPFRPSIRCGDFIDLFGMHYNWVIGLGFGARHARLLLPAVLSENCRLLREPLVRHLQETPRGPRYRSISSLLWTRDARERYLELLRVLEARGCLTRSPHVSKTAPTKSTSTGATTTVSTSADDGEGRHTSLPRAAAAPHAAVGERRVEDGSGGSGTGSSSEFEEGEEEGEEDEEDNDSADASATEEEEEEGEEEEDEVTGGALRARPLKNRPPRKRVRHRGRFACCGVVTVEGGELPIFTFRRTRKNNTCIGLTRKCNCPPGDKFEVPAEAELEEEWRQRDKKVDPSGDRPDATSFYTMRGALGAGQGFCCGSAAATAVEISIDCAEALTRGYTYCFEYPHERGFVVRRKADQRTSRSRMTAYCLRLTEILQEARRRKLTTHLETLFAAMLHDPRHATVITHNVALWYDCYCWCFSSSSSSCFSSTTMADL